MFKEFCTLKDGSTVVIRPLTSEDTEKLYEFFLSGIEERDLLLFKDNVQDFFLVKKWTENIDYDKVFPVVAEAADGSIIGTATLHMKSFGWEKDVGKLRVSICKTCRGRGLGKALTEKIIEIARQKGLRVLIAEVLSLQEHALTALKSLGFEEEVVIKDLAYVLNKTCDLHILVLRL